jgi:dihydroorotate dehydrogenase
MLYKYFIRPLLFCFNPEKVHYFITALLRGLNRLPGFGQLMRFMFVFDDPRLKREVFGISFRNPVGLAAGFDKDAEVIDAFSNLGFGFIEIGTLTPEPQPGNPRPRLFRLKKDEALINRMGFNNKGVMRAVQKLKKRKSDIIVGGNIGKNKITPNDKAVSDYIKAFEALFDYVDYFVINVSSPNTPNLRALQEKEPLKKLLSEIQARNQSRSNPKPVLLKIAPDLTNDQLDDIIDIVESLDLNGVVATNTTIRRENLLTGEAEINKIGAGGLSGKPLRERSTEVIRYLKQHAKRGFPIIGVGGINTPEDAMEKLNAGASLIQIYTGFIYQGPGFVKNINRAIVKSRPGMDK